jgi:hypothetical protein
MRRLMTALLIAMVPAMLVTSASGAAAEDFAPAAEVHCASFSNVNVRSAGQQYFLHVPSTGWDSYNYNCVLARGDHNVGVLALQESLNACYGQGLAQDSDFGPLTEQAVKNVQNEINEIFGNVLAVDGRFGPKTSFYSSFLIFNHWNGGLPAGKGCAYWS